MREKGMRVAAVRNASNEEVYLYGFGVYVGDEVPEAGAKGFAAIAREYNHSNPKIVLDSGAIVWGGECWWWRIEEGFDESFVKGRKIVSVPLPDRGKN